ncbi:MAG: hypothetical protein KDB80_02110, partial [Planctomycetes bacterium]|nr:hypothetical protein [Planctomycetota bacterium]
DLARLAAMPRDHATQRAPIVERLKQLREDPDLASVRDDDAIAAMPVDEAGKWRELWTDVDTRLMALVAADESR